MMGRTPIATEPDTQATAIVYEHAKGDSDTAPLAAAAPPATAATPDVFFLLDGLIVLSRRKQILLRSTLAAALLSTAIAWLLPNRYTATAKILPPQQSQSLATAMIGQLGALGPVAALAQKDLGLKNPNDVYVGMLRSRTVADELIRRFDLLRIYGEHRMSDARRKLENASSITVGKEGFISISVEDRDRSRAAQLANNYVDQLRQLTQVLAVTEAGQRRLFFERQLQEAKNNLADAEQALKETEQTTGMIQLEGQAKAIIESVGKVRALIAAKEVELHAMRLFSTEQNPDVRLHEEQLAGLRLQLGLLEKQGGGAGNLQVPAGNVPEAGLQYIRKLRDVKYCETIFEVLAKQYEAAKLDEAKSGAVIQVLDPALEPERKSSPRRTLIIVSASLLGLCAAAAWILCAEALRRLCLNPGVDSRWKLLKNSLLRADLPLCP